VLALVGDVAVEEGERKKLHAHVVLGRRDGSAFGGHPLSLRRKHDPQTGLTLIRWDEKKRKPAPRRRK
jgi:hypothetical protein